MKRVYGLRPDVIITVFILTIVIMFGMHRFIYSNRVTESLRESFLNVDGVSEVRVQNDDGGASIQIQLKQVDSLPATFSEIMATADTHLGDRLKRITIVDRRTARLQSAFHDIHYSLQESLSTGEFTQMAVDVENRLARLAIEDFEVYVDRDYIYLTLTDDDAYLYEILPRDNRGFEIRSTGVEGGEIL